MSYDRMDVREVYIEFFSGNEKIKTIRLLPFHKVLFFKGQYPDTDYIYAVTKLSDLSSIFYSRILPLINQTDQPIDSIRFSNMWGTNYGKNHEAKEIRVFNKDSEQELVESFVKFLTKKSEEWFYSNEKEAFIPATRIKYNCNNEGEKILLVFPWPSYYKYQQMISGLANYLLVDSETLEGEFIHKHYEIVSAIRSIVKQDADYIEGSLSFQLIDFYENRIRSEKVNFLEADSPYFVMNQIEIGSGDNEEIHSLIMQGFDKAWSDFHKHFSTTVPFTENDRIRDIEKLLEAIRECNDDELNYLIESEDMNVNSVYQYKDPVVFDVLPEISIEILESLIGWGMDVFSTDHDGNSLIYRAIQEADFEIVEHLFGYSDVDLQNEEYDEYDDDPDNPNWKKQFLFAPIDFYRLLTTAKDVKSLELIIKDGFDINTIIPQFGKSILHHAVDSGSPLNSIKFLVNHGADPNIQDNSGNTVISDSKTNFDKKKEEELYNKSIEFIKKNTDITSLSLDNISGDLKKIVDTHINKALESTNKKKIEEKVKELDELLKDEDSIFNPKFHLTLDEKYFFMRAYIEDGKSWFWIVDGDNTDSTPLVNFEVTLKSSQEEKMRFETILDYMIENSEMD